MTHLHKMPQSWSNEKASAQMNLQATGVFSLVPSDDAEGLAIG
ncbi:MAG TPA: hypothetical protein PKD84_03795 [Propionicimonas sp.]|nr:hypothetical protein [Propionicimonas sp.]